MSNVAIFANVEEWSAEFTVRGRLRYSKFLKGLEAIFRKESFLTHSEITTTYIDKYSLPRQLTLHAMTHFAIPA